MDGLKKGVQSSKYSINFCTWPQTYMYCCIILEGGGGEETSAMYTFMTGDNIYNSSHTIGRALSKEQWISPF